MAWDRGELGVGPGLTRLQQEHVIDLVGVKANEVAGYLQARMHGLGREPAPLPQALRLAGAVELAVSSTAELPRGLFLVVVPDASLSVLGPPTGQPPRFELGMEGVKSRYTCESHATAVTPELASFWNGAGGGVAADDWAWCAVDAIPTDTRLPDGILLRTAPACRPDPAAEPALTGMVWLVLTGRDPWRSFHGGVLRFGAASWWTPAPVPPAPVPPERSGKPVGVREIEFRRQPLAPLEGWANDPQGSPAQLDRLERRVATWVPGSRYEAQSMSSRLLPRVSPGVVCHVAGLQVPLGGLLPRAVSSDADRYGLDAIVSDARVPPAVRTVVTPLRSTAVAAPRMAPATRRTAGLVEHPLAADVEVDDPGCWLYPGDVLQLPVREGTERDEVVVTLRRLQPFRCASGVITIHVGETLVPATLTWAEARDRRRWTLNGQSVELPRGERPDLVWTQGSVRLVASLDEDPRPRVVIAIPMQGPDGPILVGFASETPIAGPGFQARPGVCFDRVGASGDDVPHEVVGAEVSEIVLTEDDALPVERDPGRLQVARPRASHWTAALWLEADTLESRDTPETRERRRDVLGKACRVGGAGNLDIDVDDPAVTHLVSEILRPDWRLGAGALRRGTGDPMLGAGATIPLAPGDLVEVLVCGLVPAEVAKRRCGWHRVGGMRRFRYDGVDYLATTPVRRRFERPPTDPFDPPAAILSELRRPDDELQGPRRVGLLAQPAASGAPWGREAVIHGRIRGFRWQGWPIPMLPPLSGSAGASEGLQAARGEWAKVVLHARDAADGGVGRARTSASRDPLVAHSEPLRRGVDALWGEVQAEHRYRGEDRRSEWGPCLELFVSERDPDRALTPLALRLLVPVLDEHRRDSVSGRQAFLAYLDEPWYGEGLAEDVLVDVGITRTLDEVWPESGADPARHPALEVEREHRLPALRVRRVTGHTFDDPRSASARLASTSLEIEAILPSESARRSDGWFHSLRLRRFLHPEFRDGAWPGVAASHTIEPGHALFLLTRPVQVARIGASTVRVEIPAVALAFSARIEPRVDGFQVRIDSSWVGGVADCASTDVVMVGLRVLIDRVVSREGYAEKNLLAVQVHPVARRIPADGLDSEGWQPMGSPLLFTRGGPADPVSGWANAPIEVNVEAIDPGGDLGSFRVSMSEPTEAAWVQALRSSDLVDLDDGGQDHPVRIDDVAFELTGNRVRVVARRRGTSLRFAAPGGGAGRMQRIQRFLVSRLVTDVRGAPSEVVVDLLEPDASPGMLRRWDVGLRHLPGFDGVAARDLRFRLLTFEQCGDAKPLYDAMFPKPADRAASSNDATLRLVGVSRMARAGDVLP